MADSDCDIEYLDEDADIVQQCVQTVPTLVQLVPQYEEKVTPLLIERQPAERRRKRRKDEEDSDYDPNEDFLPPSPPRALGGRGRKRRQHVVKKVKSYHKEGIPSLKVGPGRKHKCFPAKEPVVDRKQCNIRIPDYDDPLCLPVRAIKNENTDLKRLNDWNNVCLEHFKHCDNLLKPERGETHSSTRTVVFRNVVNKQSDKLETTIWSKTCVESEDGDRKSEIFQCVLPRYKEKKVLTTFGLGTRRPKPYHLSDEAILSKEEGKDGEVLVVYKPKESSSAVYRLVAGYDKKNADGNQEEVDDKDDDDDIKMYMKELAYLKMCAPCYQTSWRGAKKNSKKSIACPICSRSFVTVYNLLAHFKTHSSEDVQKYKRIISSILAEIVDYHYKCRICREQLSSIKQLRQHMTTHQGSEVFTCEVGNHMAR